MVRILAMAVVLATSAGVGRGDGVGRGSLSAAFERGDRDALANHALRLRARGLEPQLARRDRTAQLAAIAAAPAAPDAWELLAHLSALAWSADRRLAGDAARAGARIAEDLDRHLAEELEIPPDELELRVAAWRAVALDRTRWPDVRVHALVAVRELADAAGLPAPGYPVDALLVDDDPELRRAALELLPIPVPEELAPAVAQRAATDPDPEVAVAAAQALCVELGAGGDPAAVLARLGEPGLARVRAIIATPDLPAGAVIDAARCLLADPAPASARAVRELRDVAPPPVRRALAQLPARGER